MRPVIWVAVVLSVVAAAVCFTEFVREQNRTADIDSPRPSSWSAALAGLGVAAVVFVLLSALLSVITLIETGLR